VTDQVCRSETRVCNNGTLSGSYTESSCRVETGLIFFDDFKDGEYLSDWNFFTSNQIETDEPWCKTEDLFIQDESLIAYGNECGIESSVIFNTETELSFDLNKPQGSANNRGWDFYIGLNNLNGSSYRMNIRFDVGGSSQNHFEQDGNVCFADDNTYHCFQDSRSVGNLKARFYQNFISIEYAPDSGEEITFEKVTTQALSNAKFTIGLAGQGMQGPRSIDNVVFKKIQNQ